MDKKGFTLIELIAVITILGMLLVITIPATGRLITSNDKKMYDEYYTIVAGAANRYAKGEYYNLGGVSSSGCVELNSLDTLIESGLLKSFSTNEEDVECYLPSELDTYTNVSATALANLKDGKGPSDFYDIRITNDKGKIKIVHSLVCVKDNRNIVYKRLAEKDGTECNKYTKVESNVLYNTLIEKGLVADTSPASDTKFIKTFDNYVKYSGKLWQIVSVNTDGKIKLISNDIVSVYYHSSSSLTGTRQYGNSYIVEFNNNVFRKTLRNPDVFLASQTWNSKTVADGSAPAPSDATTQTDNIIGLLSLYEYQQAKKYISAENGPWFLLNQKSDTETWAVDSANVVSLGSSSFGGIRPSIVLRENVTFLEGGTGKKNNPYVIIGEQPGLVGDKLSTRYAGEYVNFEGKLYRIVSSSVDGTKLKSVDYVGDSNMKGAFNTTTTSNAFDPSSTVKTYLETNYFTPLTNKNLLITTKYCATPIVATNANYQTTCVETDTKSGNYAIPSIGDMYTSFAVSSEESYWTLSIGAAPPPTGKAQAYLMNLGTVTTTDVDTVGRYYPVITISPGAKIVGGDGGSPMYGGTPYTIA